MGTEVPELLMLVHLRVVSCPPFCSLLFTNDCMLLDRSVLGLISDGDEGMYQREVERLAGWCSDNNLVLNVSKTKK